jgi:hypothetical protein
VRTVNPPEPPLDDCEWATCEWVAQRLPWYLNGTLGTAERRALDAHCSGCEPCAHSLGFEQQVVDSIRAPRDNIGHSPQAAWQRFETLLDQHPRPVAPKGNHLWRSFGFRSVIVAQAAAIVALVVLLFVERLNQESPRFRTLASSDATLSIGKPLVRVALDKEMSETQAAALAASIGASIVAGPGANNVYTLALERSLNAGAVDDKVADLRRQQGVLLAEPVMLDSP